MFSMISTLNRFYNDSILRRSLETLMWHCVLLFRKAIGILRQKCTTRGTVGYKDIINGNSYCPKAISVSISSGLGCKARKAIGFNGNISLLTATWKKKTKKWKTRKWSKTRFGISRFDCNFRKFSTKLPP